MEQSLLCPGFYFKHSKNFLWPKSESQIISLQHGCLQRKYWNGMTASRKCKMRNSTRQLKLTAKINLMSEFNTLLWQGISNYKSPEYNTEKTDFYCVNTVQSSSVVNAFSSVYRGSLSGPGRIHNSVAFNTVICGSCYTRTVQIIPGME